METRCSLSRSLAWRMDARLQHGSRYFPFEFFLYVDERAGNFCLSEGLEKKRGLGFTLDKNTKLFPPTFHSDPAKANKDAPRDRPLPLSLAPLGPCAERGQPCCLGGPAGGTMQASVVGDADVGLFLSRSAISRRARAPRLCGRGRRLGRLLSCAAGVRGAPSSAFHGAR